MPKRVAMSQKNYITHKVHSAEFKKFEGMKRYVKKKGWKEQDNDRWKPFLTCSSL